MSEPIVLDNGYANRLKLCKAICRKIRFQFPNTPEHNLFFSVIQCAIMDLVNQDKRNGFNRRSALRYLRDDLVHAEACDVDADWIRSLLTKAYLI
jgi:hypothetical protein